MPTTSRRTYVEESPDYSREKLENAILYFLKRADDPSLGKTKLMKLLYFADFDHYERFRTPLTGATYFRLNEGPVPKAALDLLPVLERRQLIGHATVPAGRFTQDRYEALVEPRLDLFSADELATLDSVIDHWARESRTTIVDATHAEAPWLAVANNREIPYFLAFYRNNYGEMDLADDEVN